MPLPRITHLQFVALESMTPGEILGRHIRDYFSILGKSMTGPAFYQFMQRIEESGFSKGSFVRMPTAGKSTRHREKSYSITQAGIEAIQESKIFYSNR